MASDIPTDNRVRVKTAMGGGRIEFKTDKFPEAALQA